VIVSGSNRLVSNSYCIGVKGTTGCVFSRVGISGSLQGTFVAGIHTITISNSIITTGATIKNCYFVATVTTGAAGSSGFYGITGFYCYNCFTRCKIKFVYDNLLRPFWVRYALSYCYAANSLTDDSIIPSTAYGLGRCSSSSGFVGSFYDNQLLTISVTDVNTDDTVIGVATAYLKSDEWLRSQGWAI
jgi:hypothetical protein